MSAYTDQLERIYTEAEHLLENDDQTPVPDKSLSAQEVKLLNYIADRSEYSKGVLTVLITSLTHKIVAPNQDIRRHQSNMEGGYSGRSVDTREITPFMKNKKLTHMEESGWLTRSLEQNYPYDFKYNGKIRPLELRDAFLTLLDNIQTKHASPEKYLSYLFQKLLVQKARGLIDITRFHENEFSIYNIVYMLDEHFQKSTSDGTARLPVLAIYSVYQCMINELRRFEGKSLAALGSHTSPDYRSGDIGDIQVNNSDGTPYEGLEIKYGKKITPQLILDSYAKFQKYEVDRYYVLSTIEPTPTERIELDKVIEHIFQEHGCQFIANGLMLTISYYLRLIEDTDQFLKFYAQNLMADKVIKTEHKELWQAIISTRS